MIDRVAKGGTEIVFNVQTQWKLGQAEFRCFYRGINTVAEYHHNVLMTQVAANDNWQQAANAADIQASGFAPSDPMEATILITLQPGAYTAIVSGVGGTTGIAIVEVFRN